MVTALRSYIVNLDIKPLASAQRAKYGMTLTRDAERRARPALNVTHLLSVQTLGPPASRPVQDSQMDSTSCVTTARPMPPAQGNLTVTGCSTGLAWHL